MAGGSGLSLYEDARRGMPTVPFILMCGGRRVTLSDPHFRLLAKPFGLGELALDLGKTPHRSKRVREQILHGVRGGREFARRVCQMIGRRTWNPALRQRTSITPQQ